MHSNKDKGYNGDKRRCQGEVDVVGRRVVVLSQTPMFGLPRLIYPVEITPTI